MPPYCKENMHYEIPAFGISDDKNYICVNAYIVDTIEPIAEPTQLIDIRDIPIVTNPVRSK